MPVVSEADLVAYCDAEQLGDDAADLLVELETYVVATIEQTLGIYLGTSASRTETLNGGTSKVYLAQPPISVTSISLRYADLDTFDAMESDEYEVSGYAVRRLGVSFPEGDDTVRVVYTAGYNGATWQLPLRRLILNTVNWMAKIGRKASVEEVLKASGEIPGWNETMALYRRPSYG